MVPPLPGFKPQPPERRKSWRCFHCDDVFTDPEQARAHFGIDELKLPGCVQVLKRILELQADLTRVYAEETDVIRWQNAKVSQHAAELNRVKDVEYTRGLKEAYEEGTGVIMANDYPIAVFTEQVRAGRYVDDLKAEDHAKWRRENPAAVTAGVLPRFTGAGDRYIRAVHFKPNKEDLS